ncbi:hypothetical protein [Campylobacter rectus]|uniref:Uncharacterized protein n=1 Tax=Campylobacter rectus TaxID=203 RepID=A0A6G5QJM1_CAMRE|nr:hypothetical protein [Campylobacter rectus]QCD45895.1 hypothetical protein CRECT_0194 [Campylobacter rectus]UEB48873.1 hypothetical protein LK437_06165 [Campylobacter rectus]
MRQAFVGFDAWTVKFDKILGVVFGRLRRLKFTRPLDAGIDICRSLQTFSESALDVLGPGLDGLASFAVRAV